MDWKSDLKRLTAGCLAAAALAGSAAAWSAPAQTGRLKLARSSDTVLRMAVGSDIHIDAYESEKKLSNAYAVFKEIGGVDAAVFVGDVTNNGSESQYDALMGIINANTKTATVDLAGNTTAAAGGDDAAVGTTLICMGNHEFYGGNADRFRERTGQEINKLYWINGVPIIKMGADTPAGDFTDKYDFLKESLDTISGEKWSGPIFIMAHQAVYDTAYTTDQEGAYHGTWSDAEVSLMAQYPQIIHISGHSHATPQDPRSIDQTDGFTAIQDGTLGAYYENEYGKIDPDTGADATCPPQSTDASTCLIIDVRSDGTSLIHRLNLTTGEWIYEGENQDGPWTLHASDTADQFTYFQENVNRGYGAGSQPPVFAQEAAVTAEAAASGTAVRVSFPAAAAASGFNRDMVHEYRITLTPTDGTAAVTKRIFSDYYKAEDQQKSAWTVRINGLTSGKTYHVSVCAATSYGAESAPITAAEPVTVGTAVRTYPPRTVLDIDYSNGNTADANGHAGDAQGTADIVTDAALNRKALELKGDGGWRYQVAQDDYDRTVNEFTLECYFYAPDVTADQCLFSNQQGAGMGFELYNGKLYLWSNFPGISSSGLAGTEVKPSQWTHAVCTYDGTEVKMYLNGELAATDSAPGGLKVPASDAWYYYVGADVESGGGHAYHASNGTRINLARLYAGTMTADDVKAAWQKASGAETPSADTPADILNIDYSRGNTADANGHTAVLKGTAGIVTDAALNRQALELKGDGGWRYALDESDYGRIENSFTLESYFYMNDVTTDQCVFSNQQQSGMGYEVENGVLSNWVNLKTDSGYQTLKPHAAITAGQWVHAVTTYDGSALKLYLNGTLKDTVENASGGLKMPEAEKDARYYYVGADVERSGACGYQMVSGGRVSLARLYARPLTAEQVARAYAVLTDTQAPAGSFASAPAASCEVGAAYAIPAYTASDNSGSCTTTVTLTGPDGAVTALTDVLNGGTFTPSSAGVYTLTYTSADAAGNTTVRTVAVTAAFPAACTVSFNANGGSVTPAAASTDRSGKLAGLPVPTRSGNYSFAGWYTAPDGGTAVGLSTVFSADAALYAHWTYTGSSSGGGSSSGSSSSGSGSSSGTTILNPAVPKAETPLSFTDVAASDWFFADVSYVTGRGLMQGTEAGAFAPGRTVTRGMLAVILWRLAGQPAAAKAASFSDIADGSWCRAAVDWASSQGIADGYADGAFRPDRGITRQQLAAMLYRYARLSGAAASGNLSGYTDASQVADYAREAFAWAVAAKIVSGTTGGELNPTGCATRAQTAAVIHRLAARNS